MLEYASIIQENDLTLHYHRKIYSCVPNKSPPDFYFFSDFFRSGHPYKAPDVYLFFWYVLPGRLLGNRMIFLDFLLARTIFLVELQNFFLNQLVKLFEHQKFTLFGWVDFFFPSRTFIKHPDIYFFWEFIRSGRPY